MNTRAKTPCLCLQSVDVSDELHQTTLRSLALQVLCCLGSHQVLDEYVSKITSLLEPSAQSSYDAQDLSAHQGTLFYLSWQVTQRKQRPFQLWAALPPPGDSGLSKAPHYTFPSQHTRDSLSVFVFSFSVIPSCLLSHCPSLFYFESSDLLTSALCKFTNLRERLRTQRTSIFWALILILVMKWVNK